MNVQFDENKPIDYNYPTKKGGISNLIIKLGLAKDEAGTKKVMVVIIVVCLTVAAYFFYKSF
jgi:hypothetical protein